ncbi:hypothetical protein [Candidatus Uabimicrobium sp. HlEnr_7]|uniref:hypothetical protein n=1 Tax=Candidatus Uabimicrobium helgolandensis TaxID=3095367 RepID=UPI0035578810
MDENKTKVHKIFIGSKLANAVHYIFFGAPNAYTWDENAIECAYLRRNILKKLTRFWFSGTLDVSEAFAVHWNEEYQAYELQAELINGQTAILKHSLHETQKSPLDFDYLAREIMSPLQKKLKESGFDGLVWQAGMGNPVAANNFLYTGTSWVWIDLESGVPALIPLNPIPLFTFYIPKSFRHRRALFDDVDISQLQNYIDSNNEKLSSFLSKQEFANLQQEIDQLQKHQHAWRTTKRIERSLTYSHKKNRISAEQLQFFKRFSILWYGREIARVFWLLLSILFFSIPQKSIRFITNFPFLQKFLKAIKFAISQRYREEKARNYVRKSIHRWQQRKQLEQKTVSILEKEINKNDTSAFITDFGVHIAIKPFVKTFEYVVIPSLLVSGVVTLKWSIFLILVSGPVARSLYTIFRLIQSYTRSQKRPWVALFIGAIPVIGNLAYPAQMIYSASNNNNVATFILYDSVGKFGILMPIWGGEDTATEHFFNRSLYFGLRILKRKHS